MALALTSPALATPQWPHRGPREWWCAAAPSGVPGATQLAVLNTLSSLRCLHPSHSPHMVKPVTRIWELGYVHRGWWYKMSFSGRCMFKKPRSGFGGRESIIEKNRALAQENLEGNTYLLVECTAGLSKRHSEKWNEEVSVVRPVHEGGSGSLLQSTQFSLISHSPQTSLKERPRWVSFIQIQINL